ncbi:hypothetical protein LPN01_09620 [Sphingomonas sp. A2-49]|uniref:LexA family protein n=1 Tax=Sphingomonas sp. A2-49 TaxID=1391375 RepID=UPI0021D16D82|nr:hypothetical protein [Sphingomonas sp. A2-49]MCU6454337.1 hypothetical protein [Sphingomonas sp. A2-49]
MAHARLNLARMLSWIEQKLDAGQPTPTDAEICELFGFDSTESARTLLAELADAGKITIKGYGPDRRIALGRAKGAIASVGRVAPAVKKADVEVERAAARIAEIVQRGRKSSKAVVAENAAALLKTVATAPAEPKPAPRSEKEAVMPAKSIQIPASADDVIVAIEEHARKHDVSLGLATASLVKRGMSVVGGFDISEVPPAQPTAAMAIDQLELGALLAEIVRRVDEQARAPDLSLELADMTARAEAAEVQLAQVKAKVETLFA